MSDEQQGGRGISPGLWIALAGLLVVLAIGVYAYRQVPGVQVMLTEAEVEGFLRLSVLQNQERVAWQPVEWERQGWQRVYALTGMPGTRDVTGRIVETRRKGSALTIRLAHMPATGFRITLLKDVRFEEGEGPSLSVVVRDVSKGKAGGPPTPAELAEVGWLKPELAKALMKHPVGRGYRWEGGHMSIAYEASGDTATMRFFGTTEAAE
jgi:hypothetical protein